MNAAVYDGQGRKKASKQKSEENEGKQGKKARTEISRAQLKGRHYTLSRPHVYCALPLIGMKNSGFNLPDVFALPAEGI
jgi:hypothetical protein